MKKCIALLGIEVEVVRASDYHFTKKRGDLVLEICKFFKAGTYVSGKGARAYMDDSLLEEFSAAGIGIQWQTFEHPEYDQENPSQPFISGLSCLDMMFHLGLEDSRKKFFNGK